MINFRQVIEANVEIKGEVKFTDFESLKSEIKRLVDQEFGTNEKIFIPTPRTVDVDTRTMTTREKRRDVAEISEEEKKLIASEYMNIPSKKVDDIVKDHNLCTGTLYKILDRFGSPRRIRHGLVMTVSDIEGVKRMYADNQPFAKIMEKYKLKTRSDIRSIVAYKEGFEAFK
jgi:hypothetical protein